MSKKKFYVPLIAGLTALFTITLGAVAVADNVIADGDGIAPLVSNNTVAFGSVCTDADPAPQKTALLAINKVGGGNAYANSATVTISAATSSSELSAAGGTISLPSNWTGLGNNIQSSSISSTLTFDPSSLPAGAYSASVTYSGIGAKDGGGTLTRNVTVSVTATIVTCNTAPTLNLPADITTEAEGPSGAVVNYTVTATDAEDDPDPTPSCSPASGSTFPMGQTIVNCSVTDSASATTNGSFKIIVTDTTGPVLSLADQIVEATGPAGAAVTFTPSASDLVDGNVSVTCDANSGDTFPLGATTVNCSATDNAENTTNGSFTINVVDTTPPALTLPADIAGVEATGPGGASVNFTASAADLVDGTVPVTCDWNPGDTFPLGTTTVTCSATDLAGNTANDSFDVTVQDTTAPTIDSHADLTEEATSAAGAIVNYTSPATHDAVDGDGAAACTPLSGSQFVLGDTTVTCNATDAAENDAIPTTFVVHVVDTTAPDVTVPADITAEATSSSGAAVSFTALATDSVDGSITPTCAPASGSTFAIDTPTTVTCSATDDAGNTGSASFTVTVVDTTAPTLNLPANITTTATGNSQAVVTYSASATDLVDGSVPITCAPASGSSFPVGTTTVNCSATDAHENTANGSFTMTVTYAFTGFFQPIDNLPTLNKAKAGSSIPVKFSLGGNQGLNVFNAGFPTSKTTPCGTTAAEDVIEVTVTAGGSSLSYDATSNQYIYVWKTEKAWSGCRTLTVKFADGTVKQADIHFVK
jgi:hypothetical protein